MAASSATTDASTDTFVIIDVSTSSSLVSLDWSTGAVVGRDPQSSPTPVLDVGDDDCEFNSAGRYSPVTDDEAGEDTSCAANRNVMQGPIVLNFMPFSFRIYECDYVLILSVNLLKVLNFVLSKCFTCSSRNKSVKLACY